ncbi:MAG: sulfatase-like hydrolase/transferase [Zavarzinella sp.]
MSIRLSIILLLFTISFSTAGEQPPNIILCMTDDQGWGDASYQGHPKLKTPHLDDLSRRGIRFDRFYAAAPVCSPTRGSFLTGRHPNRFGCFLYGYPLKTEEITLPQYLQKAGYRTGHFGKWHLNGISGPGKAVLKSDPLHPGVFGFDRWVSASNFYDLNPSLGKDGVATDYQGDGSDIAVAETIKFIDAEQADDTKKPFCAVVWFGNPHLPHKALQEDLKAAGGSHYHGEIIAIDRAMGTIVKALADRRISENTIVFFCSDNGGKEVGSTGDLRGFKGSVWEGGLRVPGLLVWPSKIKPVVTAEPACTSDLLPTILDLLNIPLADKRPIDGVSWKPLIEGKPWKREGGIGFWHYAAGKKNAGNQKFAIEVGHAAWNKGNYKLHRTAKGDFQLYDLVTDRQEKNDLATKMPDLLKEYQAELTTWQKSVVNSYRGLDYPKK